jgi:hypothetical protein
MEYFSTGIIYPNQYDVFFSNMHVAVQLRRRGPHNLKKSCSCMIQVTVSARHVIPVCYHTSMHHGLPRIAIASPLVWLRALPLYFWMVSHSISEGIIIMYLDDTIYVIFVLLSHSLRWVRNSPER